MGGELAIVMPPVLGEPWFAKKGTDLVHSFVRVAPRADSSGDVVAL